ncbi:MAG: hypothetical protein KAS90_01265 [Candidatus Aenigmarchaeota archaeon]|nr:hypothetical protein [Candidatus Aenigmarchaeota archaeon]
MAASDPYWFDTSWHFRTNFTINNSNYDRDFWPVELDMNFTDLISLENKSGTFDSASVRVYEHNSTGYVLFEHPFQFDNASGFDASANAAGILTFLLNGTTTANQVRYIYVYFDIVENGAKTPVAYSSNLNYTWDGKEAHVNNSILKLKIDTLRGENTSGLYDARISNIIFMTASTASKTKEYTQLSNGTDNFSFDFRNNASFSAGPVKLVVEQTGNETLWDDPDSLTGFGLMRKRYIFYENSSWIKIEQNFTNIGASSITRNSTGSGALSINDISTPEFLNFPTWFGNITNPLSWYGISDTGSRGVGLINFNYSSNANFYTRNDSSLDRIGIHLDSVTIAPNESIVHTAVLQFDDDIYNQDDLTGLKNLMKYLPVITLENNEFIPILITSQTNYTIYNLNESVLIFSNITSDPYNITTYMNATIDMGTPVTLDDETIMLYDDGDSAHGDAVSGDGIFSGFYNLSENSTVTKWNITVIAYDSGNVSLKEENTSFNVTDIYNVSLVISNPLGIIDRLVNATIIVKNAREEYIGNAALNCTYGAGPLTNITDYDNGTYVLNFTAPASTGTYMLNCSAEKSNNTGMDSQLFYAETSETNMSLEVSPENHTSSNISLSLDDSFDISVNATDIGGANAIAVNISLSLPQNLSANSTFESCGDVAMNDSCLKYFNITVANSTVPGNYTFNISVTWLNPNLLTNTTNISFTAYVLSNPILDTTDNNVSGTVADGKTMAVGNFTVDSIGNDALKNITFNVSGLSDFTITFSPENISSLSSDASQLVSVNVTVPQDYASGNYTGTINITSVDGGSKNITLDVSVPETTILSLQTVPDNYTSSIISLYSGDSFNVTINLTNIGIADAKDANMTLAMLQDITSNSTFEQCNRLNASDSCAKMFNISISNYTSPGNYTFNITADWINPDLSLNSTQINFTVYVLSNPMLNVSGNISTALQDNSTVLAGNFKLFNFGNDNLTDTTFTVSDLPDFTITFSPVNISSLGVNISQMVFVNVSVPFAYSPGNYTGTINITSVDGGYDTVELNVTVLTRREWDITPKSCERSENPETGTVCLVSIKNTGNVPINITVNPIDVNYTSVNETNMTVLKNSTYIIEFLYNVTNVTKGFYYENYTINTSNLDAVPLSYDFNITLIPYIVPLFSVNLSENVAPQNTNIEFFVNVTDRSTIGINWTFMNVTLPNSTVETFNMSHISTNGTLSQWYFNYSGNMSAFINYSGNVSNYTGSTLTYGNYNVTIYSQDNTGVIGENNVSFKIYSSLIVGFAPGSTKYYQGSTGSIYYTLTDIMGAGISDANVTISLADPLGNIIYINDFITDSTGQVSPIPTFDLANDAPVGDYNLTADLSFYDPVLETVLTSSKNATFLLQSGSSGGGGGLTADLETAVVWYPDNVMRFEMWFSYAGNVTDPDNMTLFVYDPAENLYFNINLSDANRTSTGLYHYKYAMPIDSSSGYYFAILTASKEGFVSQIVKPFRVAKGGPYDVRVTILPPMEVLRQDYVNFEILIENMGEVTQDVFLDYWVSYGNETYYYNSEAVLTPVGVNVTILRNAYIFSNQQIGLNTLNVKATYDNVQAPIIAVATFEVIEDDIDIPPPPDIPDVPEYIPPSGGSFSDDDSDMYDDLDQIPVYEKDYSINIESYNKEINIVQGWTDITGVRVRNNGNLEIKNITLILTGIPTSWYNITPKMYEVMPSGNSTLFLIEYKIPAGSKSGAYPFTLVANSNEIVTDKIGRLVVFTSIEDLIRQDIINLKIELHKLEDAIYFSQNIGKDVSRVWGILEQAWIQIEFAEDNLDNKKYDEALQNIQVVSGLIKQAKMILETPSEVDAADWKDSIWIFALKVLVVLAIFAYVSVWWIRKKDKYKLKASLKRYMKKSLSKEEIETRKKEFEKDKERIQRVLKLLETESKEGIINNESYKELKQLNESKILNIDKKIKKLK